MTRVARSAAARSRAALVGVKASGEAAASRTSSAGANCSSACVTKDHASWGECVRSKGLQVSPAVSDSYGSRQKAWDKELNNYESAVRQGLSPAGTKQHHVDAAMKEAGG
jgi:hypothetical protein